MRKLFAVVMTLAIIGLLSMVSPCFAVDATEAINPEAEPVILYGKSGDGIEKFSSEPIVKSITGDEFIYAGPCRVYTINLYSDTLGDLIGIWDFDNILNSNGWLEFEVAIAANTSSKSINLHGAKFSRGLYISTTDKANTIISVVYDY